jgi:hypothetical protein
LERDARQKALLAISASLKLSTDPGLIESSSRRSHVASHLVVDHPFPDRTGPRDGRSACLGATGAVQYEPQLYLHVTSTLYRFFGLVGGPLQVLALLFSIVLVWFIRARAAFRSTLAGTLCLSLSLLLWFMLVQPVNAAWLEALRTGPSEAVQAYAQLRNRWEAGHVAAFTAWLTGFTLLLYGVLREIPWLSSRA